MIFCRVQSFLTPPPMSPSKHHTPPFCPPFLKRTLSPWRLRRNLISGVWTYCTLLSNLSEPESDMNLNILFCGGGGDRGVQTVGIWVQRGHMRPFIPLFVRVLRGPPSLTVWLLQTQIHQVLLAGQTGISFHSLAFFCTRPGWYRKGGEQNRFPHCVTSVSPLSGACFNRYYLVFILGDDHSWSFCRFMFEPDLQ